ncbi:unnamed protein product, partial [Rotaria sp. Silwood1]
TDLLFNSTDLRPNEICPARRNCSGEEFCWASYVNEFDGTAPKFHNTCVNSTNQPFLEWVELLTQELTVEEMSYICNKASCASSTTVQRILEMIERYYVLPLNVIVPPTTTTTRSSTISTSRQTTSTPASTSLISTSTKSVARSIHTDKTEKIFFVLFSVVYVCFFEI